MPAQKRHPTGQIGIYYIVSKPGTRDEDKIYYIDYRKPDGKRIQEKAGYASKGMTPAKANNIRSDRQRGKELSNKERREAEKAAKREKDNLWTIDRLWTEYRSSRNEGKSLSTDSSRYEKYLKNSFGAKQPSELAPLDVDRLRISLQKKLSPQTVKHVLNLLSWIVNYGVKKNLCHGISFHVQKPVVNNLITEDLSANQLKALLKAIEEDKNIQVKNLMKMALYTGMRRGELFKLRWDHIDFERGFIRIIQPKGGIDQVIPMNYAARQVLENHPRPKFKVTGTKSQHFESPYIFPGRNGKQRISCQAGTNVIKKKAGLPKNFRPMHGLRHVYASMLASSGKVDLYTLQKLLTHKSPVMTQRYAHLRDEALKKASNLVVDLFTAITSQNGNNEQSA